MSESTLSITYSDLQKAVGHYLGYGRDSTAWDTSMQADIDDAIVSGLRQFYYPPPLSDDLVGHVWSFLRPAATIDLTADTGEYDLPDDYQSIEGGMTFSTSETHTVVKTGEERIRQLRQADSSTGKPQQFAIRAKTSDGSTGQRSEVIFWPVPDASMTLKYSYNVLPNALSDLKPNPLGGMSHAETIKESCLACAEQLNEDSLGIHTNLFMQKLAASVAVDRKAGDEGFLGSMNQPDEDSSPGIRRGMAIFINGDEV